MQNVLIVVLEVSLHDKENAMENEKGALHGKVKQIGIMMKFLY
jgi:hypothetical protein